MIPPRPASPRSSSFAPTMPERATSSVPLHGAELRLWRVVWVVVAVALLALNVLGTSASYAQALRACVGNQCNDNQLAPSGVYSILASGISLHFYAAYVVVLYWAGVVIYTAIAFIIFWRRSDDRMALFGSFALLVFGAGPVFGTIPDLPSAYPALAPLARTIWQLGLLPFYAFFSLFPSGRFVPSWMRWVVFAYGCRMLLALFPWALFQDFGNNPLWFFIVYGLLAGAQVYRYRQVSTPVQRQQTKWVVFGFAVGLGGFLLVFGFINALPVPLANGPGILLGDTLRAALLCLIPTSIGIAILRSGLFDIDVLINRTLVYGTLSALLGGMYFGSVVLLQQIARSFNGQRQDSTLVIILSTLLIAALFQPLRRRIQRTIDQRFYRAKYDAAKTVERFAATLRQQVELDQLNAHLVEAVQETMRPEHVSLWLRSPHSDTRT